MNKKLLSTALFVFISLLCLYVFYPNVTTHLNSTYFATDHDGLQNYYGNWYHVKYDTAYLSTKAMNYPNGEFIYYTGAQIVPTAVFKFVNDHIVDTSAYWIGIQNAMMLLSIVFCTLFIYLIFRRLKIGYVFAAIWALAITFLSPQLDRLGGHFSLAYLFVVPLTIYLIMLFDEKKEWKYSIIIAFLGFWSYTTHPYFFGLMAFLLLFYWVYVFVTLKEMKWTTKLLHFFVQFILPVIIARSLEGLYCNVADRTENPWGFLVYRAFPESVFLNMSSFYWQWLNKIVQVRNVEWEGVAYVGLVAVIFTFVVLYKIIRKLVKKQFAKSLEVTDNHLLNIFFWASLAALIYSFGLPFIAGLESLVQYLGPLKQMRGIGRFTWVFFYVINIILVYKLWQWKDKKTLYKYLLIIPSLIIIYDAYSFSKNAESRLNNQLPELHDAANTLPENRWVKDIDTAQYQAIIAVPYFHLGSENIWMETYCSVLKQTFYASMKTGLPIVDFYYSRSSISQSFDNISISREPYKPLNIVPKFPNKKPFLLLACKCDQLTVFEQDLVKKAKLVDETSNFTLYSLPFEVLEHIADSLYDKAFAEYNAMDKAVLADVYSKVVTESFDSLQNNQGYNGTACFTGLNGNFNQVWEGLIPNLDTAQQYLVSFWFGNILTDVQLRSTSVITYSDSLGNTLNEDWASVQSNLKIFDNNWALIEQPLNKAFLVKKGKIKITFINKDNKKGTLLVDE